MNIEHPTSSIQRRTIGITANSIFILHPSSFILLAVLLLGGCTHSSSSPQLNSRFFDHVEIIGSRGVGLGQFLKPRSVVVDRKDNLYATDITARVQKYDPNGKLVLFWQAPLIDQEGPKGMAIDPDGDVILLESHAAVDIVNLYSPDGKLLRKWGVRGTAPGQFDSTRNVMVGPTGNLFVCESGESQRVQELDSADGKPIRHWGGMGDGPGQFSRPEGMAWGKNGTLLVADSCNHRIQKFTPDGRFLSAFGRAGAGLGELSYPYDVKTDQKGNVFVCEYGNSRIQVFAADDTPIECIGGVGAAPGHFNNPWSIALDSKGNLYVADSGNHRVVKLVRKD